METSSTQTKIVITINSIAVSLYVVLFVIFIGFHNGLENLREILLKIFYANVVIMFIGSIWGLILNRKIQNKTLKTLSIVNLILSLLVIIGGIALIILAILVLSKMKGKSF